VYTLSPSLINLFLISQAQAGKTFGTLHRYLSAITFTLKFYLVQDFVADNAVNDFLQKFVSIVQGKRMHLVRLMLGKFGTE